MTLWGSPETVETCPRRRYIRARRKYDREFREGAVRIVKETGKPIARVVRDLGSLGSAQGRDPIAR